LIELPQLNCFIGLEEGRYNMNCIFWERNIQNLLTPLNLKYIVKRYSHSVFGGPKLAEISAVGPDLDLWELAEYAGRPIKIISDKGDAVWWGMVGEIKINIGAWAVGINIDSMANVVGVAYEDDEAQGQPKKTSWAEDFDSIAEYGRREILITSSGSNEIHAIAARDKYLSEKRYPIPIINPRKKDINSVTLTCRGWFDSLAWRYAMIPPNLAYSYETIGSLDYSFGNNNAQQAAQGIWFSGDCNLASISVYVRKVGSPTDNLQASLCVNSDGITPGAELTTGTIAAASLGTDYAWVNIPVTEYLFSDYDSYFIKLSRTGSQDNINYFQVCLDNVVKYPLGAFVVLVGANWDAGPDADMPFRLYSDDIIETTQQIATLVSNYGQFLQGISIENQSGLYTASARDGNANAYYEISELLKMGSSNYRRILARIDEYRKMIVYEEPAIPLRPNMILQDGSLRDSYDTQLRKELCPVGIWARFKDIIPASVDTTKLADPSMMFIDEAEYTPENDQLSLTPRGFIDPFQIGRPKDG
jgi:hypothetical protein